MCRSSGLGFRSWRSTRRPPPLWSPSSWQPPRNSDLPLESTQGFSSYVEDIISAQSTHWGVMLLWIKPWKQSQYLTTILKHTYKIFKIPHCHVLYYCAKLLGLTNTISDRSCALQLNRVYCVVSYCIISIYIESYHIVLYHIASYHSVSYQQKYNGTPWWKKRAIWKI